MPAKQWFIVTFENTLYNDIRQVRIRATSAEAASARIAKMSADNRIINATL